MHSRRFSSTLAALFALFALAHVGMGCGTKADKPNGATTPKGTSADATAVVAEKPGEP